MKRKRKRARKQVTGFSAEEEEFFRAGDSVEHLEPEYERPTSWLRRLFSRAVP